MESLQKQIKEITGHGRPTFYAEVVMNDKGMELLADAWAKKDNGYFVILTYWHQILEPYVVPKKVLTLAELVICPMALRTLKGIQTFASKEVLFNIRRVDLEGYDGWDKFDYD